MVLKTLKTKNFDNEKQKKVFLLIKNKSCINNRSSLKV